MTEPRSTADEATMDDLPTIAARYETSKWGPPEHRHAQHYHAHFQRFRRQPVRVLEIGIGGYNRPRQGGGSLRMWKEYFPLGTIIGVDVFDKSRLAEDRIVIIQGDQTDSTFLDSVGREHGPFDVVVDDGSHHCADVISTFDALFPHVAMGGMYAMEDIQSGYWPAYGGSSEDTALPTSSIGYAKQLIDRLNHAEIISPGYQATYVDRHIFGVFFYHNLVIIEKGENADGSGVIRENTASPELLEWMAAAARPVPPRRGRGGDPTASELVEVPTASP